MWKLPSGVLGGSAGVGAEGMGGHPPTKFVVHTRRADTTKAQHNYFVISTSVVHYKHNFHYNSF